ncbi:MAG: ABC transporter permease, partial [Limisphaerales bacterium]
VCSTRFDMIPTLAICSTLFLIGLMSDYLLGRRAESGQWWASALYTITPNWQLFWVADLLESGKKFPWGYLGKAFGYVVGYVGAALMLALFLFEDRELS